MNSCTYREAAPFLHSHGRTWTDGRLLHFNWSCSGFELLFEGSFLAADFEAACTLELEGLPFDANVPSHAVWPWVGVFLDGEVLPSRRFECGRARSTEILFSSPQPEKHRIRVAKLTENLKTYLALASFSLEGAFLPLPAEHRRSIELIGDSITCGFGNESRERDRFFFSADENGWLSHGAIAARELGMDWSMLSISGITLGAREGFPLPYVTNAIYTDTDRPGQERVGHPVEAWDFAAHPTDYVVVNLGTNDANAISLAEEPEKMEADFDRDYVAFLKLLRRCNGPETHIVCALGSMDYYLYDNIVRAVEAYRAETGDESISLLKYMRISPADPLGACAHPNVVTQEKMAETLTKHIRALEKG